MSGAVQALIGSLKAAAAVAKDTFFKYVTLLLPGNGTNGAQNNTFIDSSTNNFTITRNGNTTQGTFTPYGANWSNYFDGTGDYLSTSGTSSFNPSTGSWTFEAWCYFTSSSNTDYLVTGLTSGTASFYIAWIGTAFYVGDGVINNINGIASSKPVNQWFHVAVVKNGSTYTAYINGSSIASSTTALASLASTTFEIGARSPASSFSIGYISNFRYSQSAVYTTAFTPPASPVTGGALLTCQSNRFIDNSTNAFTITRNGDVSVQRFSPFNPTDAYSTSVIGGSGYFDGTGDYLSVPRDNAFLPVANEDFTVEAWVYLTATPGATEVQIAGLGEYGIDADWFFGINSSLQVGFYINASATFYRNTTTALTLNSWNHVAVSRSGTGSNNLRVYVNGVGQSFTTNSTTVGNGLRNLTIGADQNGDESNLKGYISNLRIVKGTAVYTANFTPTTAPLTAITNTQLLLNFTNAGIIDNAMLNDLETVGNAQISTAQSKFGGSSMYFDETGDYLTVPVSTNISVGTGDFTIECWVRFAVSTVGNGQGVYQLSNGYLNSQVRGPALGCENSVGDWAIYYGTTFTQSGTVPTAGVWYHTAIVRSSGTTKLYVDGTSIISVADTTNYTDQYFTIGGWYSTGFLLNGYIDDLRITKGVARYTANFTPPAQAFPTS